MRRACVLAALLLLGPTHAFFGNLLGNKRGKVEVVLKDKYGAAVRWLDDKDDLVSVSETFYRWLDDDADACALGLPGCVGEKEARSFVEQASLCPMAPAVDEAELGDDLAYPKKFDRFLLVKKKGFSPAGLPKRVTGVTAASTRLRMEAFVDRVLVGLRQCPFTANKNLAAVGLEDLGIRGAPILYAHSSSTTAAALMADTYKTLGDFLKGGEKAYSSILLAAPAWDGEEEWREWYRQIFPLLEESVVAAQLGRKIGIVCFHDSYSTPDSKWLALNRFGHQYAPATLRKWALQVDPDFEVSSTDEDLQYLGSYMRRTPHACINVLWSKQLEAAETLRVSQELYIRNVKRLDAEGREALEEEHAAEKQL
ncbi:hypothetical protein M885DRAFT_514439 [Pelagophyceae sp. CCMP2097]|nr:hypothetical protein M885DRAFT_514439 [Pelagophyceae sp. CCMP2097]|mmetsp:Transcript_20251/g.68602  ORF Transcript_20251/g.68602 Transcript_20251/m.68602 type:complete len:368 (-) Transcript_20251:26-1129(-)